MLFGGLADWRMVVLKEGRVCRGRNGAIRVEELITTPVPSLAGMILERRGMYVVERMAPGVAEPHTPLLPMLDQSRGGDGGGSNRWNSLFIGTSGSFVNLVVIQRKRWGPPPAIRKKSWRIGKNGGQPPLQIGGLEGGE